MTDEATELFDQSEGVQALRDLQATLDPNTQRELAKIIYCSEGTLSEVYKGKRVGVELASDIEFYGKIRVELFGFLPTERQLGRRGWTKKEGPSSKRKSR